MKNQKSVAETIRAANQRDNARNAKVERAAVARREALAARTVSLTMIVPPDFFGKSVTKKNRPAAMAALKEYFECNKWGADQLGVTMADDIHEVLADRGLINERGLFNRRTA